MAILVCNGEVAIPLEIADGFGARLRGLMGRPRLEGAFYITRTSSVHTFGMQFAIDVAFLDSNMFVFDTIIMQPWGISIPRRRARSIVEAAAGSFKQWGISQGCKLEIRP